MRWRETSDSEEEDRYVYVYRQDETVDGWMANISSSSQK
jgi:hypothetical protein